MLAGSGTVTVLPVAGSNRWPCEGTTVVYAEPSVLPSTLSVWVRAPQAGEGGSFSTSRRSARAWPRSTVQACGKALLADSQ